MKKEVKEYIRYTMIGTIMIYVVVIFLFFMASFVWFDDDLKIISIVVGILIIHNLIVTIMDYVYYKKNNNSAYYKKVDKELNKPLLHEDHQYILTDNYIINLKNGHLFRYDDIKYLYRKIGFGGATNHAGMKGLFFHAIFNKYLYITTQNNDCDRYAIERMIPITIGDHFEDFSEIIKSKNPKVKEIEPPKMSKKKKILVSCIWAFVILCLFSFFKYGHLFYIIDNFRFTYTRRNSVLEETFPEKIPTNVIDYEFHRSIMPFQGGTDIVLYYKDDNLNTISFDEKYRDGATFVGNYESFENHDNIMITSFIYTPIDDEDRKQDFTIYIYRDKCDDSGYCNHGTLIMNAINPKTKEVVHQYSSW